MSSDSTSDTKPSHLELSNSKKIAIPAPEVCVIVGHGIEAITSTVVLASLGQTVHLYADSELLEQQLQQYGFEHHLQALWQLYNQQQQIVCQPLPGTYSSV